MCALYELYSWSTYVCSGLFIHWGHLECFMGQSLPCPVWTLFFGRTVCASRWVLHLEHFNVCSGWIINLGAPHGVPIGHISMPWLFLFFGRTFSAYWGILMTALDELFLFFGCLYGGALIIFILWSTYVCSGLFILWGHLMVCLLGIYQCPDYFILWSTYVCSGCIFIFGRILIYARDGLFILWAQFNVSLGHTYRALDHIINLGAPQCVLWMYIHWGALPCAYWADFTLPGINSYSLGHPHAYFGNLYASHDILWIKMKMRCIFWWHFIKQ